MKTKVCTKCNIEKELSEFYFRKDSKKYRNTCKTCVCGFTKNYKKKNKKIVKQKEKIKKDKFPWIYTYYSIKQRCTNPNDNRYHRYGGRGIKRLITKEELKQLWFRDRAYDMKKPSIDRIDNNGHYELSNCRFIEHKENIPHKINKIPILQYDLDGNFIREWESITKASKHYNVHRTNISRCVRKLNKIGVGFIWRYKNENK